MNIAIYLWTVLTKLKEIGKSANFLIAFLAHVKPALAKFKVQQTRVHNRLGYVVDIFHIQLLEI